MPLFSRSRLPLLQRIQAAFRRKLSGIMANKEPSSPPVPPEEQISSETVCHRAPLDGYTAFTSPIDVEQVETRSSQESFPSTHDDTSISNDDEALFQPRIVELRPVDADAAEDTSTVYEQHFTSMPIVYVFPSPPSHSTPLIIPTPNLESQHHSPSQTTHPQITIQERLQKRAECLIRLQNGTLPDPFGEWASLSSGMYGGTLPPEFYLSSAPFPLHSLRGRARLRYICNGLSLPLDTSVFYIQDFLSRNPSIIRYLAFNLVPHPDLIFSEPSQDYEVNVEDPNGRKQNRRMLRAIRQLEWVDQSVSHVAEKSRAGSLEDWDALAAMTKVRQSAILPSVYKKMLEQNLWSTDKKWRKKWQRRAVAKMRQDRPTSLLSIIVMPEDVVEEETF